MIRRTALALVAIALLGCPPPKPTPTPTPSPTPTPTPTPTPGVDEFPNLVLKRNGNRLLYADGSPFTLRSVMYCCVEVTGTGWCGINKATIDRALAEARATMVEIRIGPFSGAQVQEYASLGGGYKEPLPGKVDLDYFNTPYWEDLVSTVRYANSKGVVAYVTLVDDWIMRVEEFYGKKRKVAIPRYTYSPLPYPWHPEGNIQSEDARSQAPTPGGRQEQWIRKAVQTLYRLGVVWSVDNESGVMEGFDYTRVIMARANIVRDEEARLGATPHLIAQNSDDDAGLTDPVTGIFVLHGGTLREPLDKVLYTNEYNPEPAADCATIVAQRCKARQFDAWVGVWRHTMSLGEFTCAQGRISEIDAGIQQCTSWEKDGCSINPPTVASIKCKRHSGDLYDCTPQAGGQPIRPEGTMDRPDCEWLSMGKGYPIYTLVNVTGSLSLTPRGNPMQFVVHGTGTGMLSCTVPARGSANVCRSSTGGDLWITR